MTRMPDLVEKERLRQERLREERIEKEKTVEWIYKAHSNGDWILYDENNFRKHHLDKKILYQVLQDGRWVNAEVVKDTPHKPHLTVDFEPVQEGTPARVFG